MFGKMGKYPPNQNGKLVNKIQVASKYIKQSCLRKVPLQNITIFWDGISYFNGLIMNINSIEIEIM